MKGDKACEFIEKGELSGVEVGVLGMFCKFEKKLVIQPANCPKVTGVSFNRGAIDGSTGVDEVDDVVGVGIVRCRSC